MTTGKSAIADSMAFTGEGQQQESREIADRNRLISKGKGVLDLCIEQNKLLCVQGFVDSQIERGGVYLEVVREMQEYISAELAKEKSKRERTSLGELHSYIADKLHEIAVVGVVVQD